MVWNGIGIVRSHISESENSIEVEFHDSLTHHGIHMNNYLGHTMASLSNSVLAMACETPRFLLNILHYLYPTIYFVIKKILH